MQRRPLKLKLSKAAAGAGAAGRQVAHAKKKGNKTGGGGGGGAKGAAGGGGGGGSSTQPAGTRSSTKEVREGTTYAQETRKIILSLQGIKKTAPNGKQVLNNINLGCVRACVAVGGGGGLWLVAVAWGVCVWGWVEPGGLTGVLLLGAAPLNSHMHTICCCYRMYLGAKIGILGANGAGKSTLMRILAGEDTSFDGRLMLAPGIRCVCVHRL